MHRLTGTDSTQPTVNMGRQDRISALAVRRCIYLPLTQTHNSTEPQLPRLRGADNTCKRHHSQPLPAHKYSLLFTLSVWTALHRTALAPSTAERLCFWSVCECVCICWRVWLLHVFEHFQFTCDTTLQLHGEITRCSLEFFWSKSHHLNGSSRDDRSSLIKNAPTTLFHLSLYGSYARLISCRPSEKQYQ